jgi:hypothetical protein
MLPRFVCVFDIFYLCAALLVFWFCSNYDYLIFLCVVCQTAFDYSKVPMAEGVALGALPAAPSSTVGTATGGVNNSNSGTNSNSRGTKAAKTVANGAKGVSTNPYFMTKR